MKRGLKCLLLILVISLLVSCGYKKDKDKLDTTSLEERIKKQVSQMTLREKIGQMLIVSYRSTVADNNLISILNDVKPGGFILFSENFESYEQTKKFISDVNATSDIPMIWSIDQEGGKVQRLKKLSDKEVTLLPNMYSVGATKNMELAKEIGRVTGEELAVFGINMDFAPVADIYSNPNNTVIGKRSFGNDYQLVSDMSLAFAQGLESVGVIPVYKHFPGHGDTSVDSHYALPVINKTKKQLMDMELKPFINAINNDAKVIMIGHLAVPQITGDNTPASLSQAVVTDLLKKELGYDGLVVTDALNMGALTNSYSKDEIYVRAINAGVDLLLMASPARDAVASIEKAVNNGQISEKKIDESVTKILLLKYKYLNNNKKYDSSFLGSVEHKEIINKIPLS